MILEVVVPMVALILIAGFIRVVLEKQRRKVKGNGGEYVRKRYRGGTRLVRSATLAPLAYRAPGNSATASGDGRSTAAAATGGGENGGGGGKEKEDVIVVLMVVMGARRLLKPR